MVVPSELVEQFCRRRAVLFVGAGVSRTAGLPSWQELIEPLKRELGDCPDGATPIDIAQYFLTGHRMRRLAEIVRTRLTPTNVAPTEAHRLIATLPLYRIFTTNLDALLEDACERANVPHQVIYNSGTLEAAEEGKLAIIKLHGDLREPASIILATEDYDDYSDRNPDLADELRYALRRQTVLFVGYGFNDPNINAIFRTVRRISGRLARNHYIVLTSPHHLVRAELERRGLQVISLPGTMDQTTELIQWLRDLALEVRLAAPYRARTNLRASAAQLRLIGRDEERRAVLDALSDGRVVVIRGSSGVGKTSLAMDIAVEWAHHGGPKDLEHLVWLSATDHSGRPYSLNEILDAIGNAVGNPVVAQSRKTDNKKTSVQAILARPTLLIMDNFAVDSDERILQWLRKETPARILICSQHSVKDKLKDAHEILLGGLKAEKAIELVKCCAGEFGPFLQALDQELPIFVNSCLRNPRALELAVGLMQSRQFNLHTIAEQVSLFAADEGKIIDKLLESAMQTLTRPARQVLRCAAILRVSDLHENALLRGTGLADAEFRTGLEELVRFRLIETLGSQRYALHQEVRAAVGRRTDLQFWLDPDDALRRCAAYYRDWVRSLVSRPGLPRYWNALVNENMRYIDPEWPIISELMNWATEKRDEILVDLVFLLVHYMDSRFLNGDRVTYVQAAVDILKSDRRRDADRALLMIDALGWTFVERNSPDGTDSPNGEVSQDPEKVIRAGLELVRNSHHIEQNDMTALAHAWLARLEMQRGKGNDASQMDSAKLVADKCSAWIRMRIHMAAGDIKLKAGDAEAALKEYVLAKSITMEYGGEGDGYQLEPRIGMARVAKDPDAAKEIFERLRDVSTVPIARFYGAYGVAVAAKYMGHEDEARRLVARADRELQQKTEPNHLIDWLKSWVVGVAEVEKQSRSGTAPDSDETATDAATDIPQPGSRRAPRGSRSA